MEKQMEDMVTIVMPVYNSHKYIEEAIISIIHQTYKNWEMLIVNEFGSSEEGTRLIRRYSEIDERIRLIQNTVKLGIAESLNEGLRQAKGKYIARMDADDIALPDRLSKQVKFLEENGNILLCGTQVEVFGGEYSAWKVETDYRQVRQDILLFTPCIHPTIMFRRSVIDSYKVFYNKNYMASEDFDFFTRVIRFGEIANLPEVLFKYRLYGTNATYINNDIGYRIYSEIMQQQFKMHGLEFSEEETNLLSEHFSLKGYKGERVLDGLVKLDLLLKKIFFNIKTLGNREELFCLFKTLHRRFKNAFDSLSWSCKDYDAKKVENVYKNSLFSHEEFYTQTKFASITPSVTVLLPVYNSENYIAETLWSLFSQSFSDYELLIINEYGSSQACMDVISFFDDNRIRIINNKYRLGLAESLNEGIRQAKGKYIARIDGDDLARFDRLAKQYAFLEKHREYGLCGSWQHHFGTKTEHIHRVPEEHDEIKASLLYNCEICHSTIMIDRDKFIKNNLYYDASMQAEDYELWTRAIRYFKFYNIPKVLGEYRVREENITRKKIDALSKESGELTYKNISTTLNVDIPVSHIPYLSGWINELGKKVGTDEYKGIVDTEQKILLKMWDNNNILKVYSAKYLLKVINRRWRWVINRWDYGADLGEILPIDLLFKVYNVTNDKAAEFIDKDTVKKRGIKETVKAVLRFFHRPFKHGMIYRLRRQVWDLDGHLTDSVYDLKNNLWDAERRLGEKLKEEVQGVKNHTDEDIRQCFDRINLRMDYIESLVNNLSNFLEIRSDALTRITDSRIRKAEKNLGEQFDGRIWKAEKSLGEQFDGRVWKAEKSLGEQFDGRIWKAEKNLEEQFDGRIWKAEKNLGEQFDGRIWKAEENLTGKIKEGIDFSDQFRMIHRHIDFSYTDLFVLLNRYIEHSNDDITVETEYPVAYESYDHLVPHGTVRDNTRYPRFIYACEKFFGHDTKLAFADLGCSGGGIVLDALLRGHEAVGLEGSDESLKQQRAEWRIIPNNLFTCDITKPFNIIKNREHMKFDVISAWEVLEHIKVEDLGNLLDNIRKHLKDGGIFVASIANWDDIDEATGVNWHVNQHPYEWWKEKFEKMGFEVITGQFSPYDLARGTINPSQCYELPYAHFDLNSTFYIVTKK